MSKFNKKSSVTKTTNLAGGVAFKLDSATELLHAVLTTFLEDKHYESGDARMKRIAKLVGENDPEYVARLAIVARKEFNLRSVTHVLIGELAKTHKGDSLVMNTIINATLRPDDLTELVSYVGTPLPKQVKRGVRNAILKFDRYQLAKYKQEGKKVSLVDLFNLTHPKPQHATKEQQKAWRDLMEGKLKSFDTWEVELSKARDEEDGKEALEKLVLENKMGYMALLRNLNNLIKYDVSPKTIKATIKKLTDPYEVKKSKQLPFRFIMAYNNVTENRLLKDAVSEAMDIAVSNVPHLEGKTLIAIDTSGSMSGDPIEKASIFGATLLKANKDADVILYDTSVKAYVGSARPPVVDIVKDIMSKHKGGGTYTDLVFKYAMTKSYEYDRIIIISDNESWVGNAQNMYKAYKNATGHDPYVYAIDIQGYGTKDITGGRVFNLSGWSERLLDFIGKVEDGDTLIDYIRDYEIEELETSSKREIKTRWDRESREAMTVSKLKKYVTKKLSPKKKVVKKVAKKKVVKKVVKKRK